MNIIIPLGGKGIRFVNEGYTVPKPLIKIFEKTMIEYVLDNINTSFTKYDKLFIIYNKNLDNFNFKDIIISKYPKCKLIKLENDTSGAAETLLLGIKYILSNYEYYKYNQKSLILDCDTFYTENIIKMFRESNDNCVFYTKKDANLNSGIKPIYSYIKLDNEISSNIIEIAEKCKISENANTGAYAFLDIKLLYKYCNYVIDNKITFKNELNNEITNEPYTSCVINEMLKDNICFKGVELENSRVFSLGTPNDVKNFIDSRYAYLFDLDGTLVITDDIYFDVWSKILYRYNITLTNDMFKNYIQGNNDIFVIKILNINIELKDLSIEKDTEFIKHIHKICVIDGVNNILQIIKETGHKCCIVTNCNKLVAHKIIKYINIEKYIDFIISADDCKQGKPNPEPYLNAMNKYNIINNKCFIFEDSKSGLLSASSVHPKKLIGIETIYDKIELMKHNINLTIKNYKDFDIQSLIYDDSNNNTNNNNNDYNNNNTNIKNIKNMIINSNYSSIIDVNIDETKLKGGFIADVVKFTMKTNINNINCILKYENKNITNLSFMANKLDLYEREYYFYEYISHYINIKIPKFYGLVKDENNKNFGLILENLFINRDIKNNINENTIDNNSYNNNENRNLQINLNLNTEKIDISLTIIKKMALMHCNFWNKDLKKKFSKLNKNNDKLFNPFLNTFISEKKEIFKSKWNIMFNDKQKKICDIIFDNFINIQENLSNNNLTFIHGDIKSPNIFYDISNNEPYFIDWQHCAIGKGVQDLIFFIIESFDINNIKLLFPLFKNYYYKILTEHNIINYSFLEYENDIKDAISYIPFFTSIWFGSTPNDELIDKNWPYFFIQKLFYLLELIY
jgi:HAD superfamily hydrolase (TIGR01509 family)